MCFRILQPAPGAFSAQPSRPGADAGCRLGVDRAAACGKRTRRRECEPIVWRKDRVVMRGVLRGSEENVRVYVGSVVFALLFSS